MGILQYSYNTVHRTRLTRNPGEMTATPTKADLCSVSRKLYSLVREELAVPLRKGYEEHATANRHEAAAKSTIGSQVSHGICCFAGGRLRNVLLDCGEFEQEN